MGWDEMIAPAGLKTKPMPKEDFDAMFSAAGITVRLEAFRTAGGGRATAVWYQLDGGAEWRDGGLRCHYRKAANGDWWARYENAAKAMLSALLLDRSVEAA